MTFIAGTVAHTCNPHYSGVQDHSLRLALVNSKAPFSTNKPGMMEHICDPSYKGVTGRKTTVHGV
jgi:hypothetical protein